VQAGDVDSLREALNDRQAAALILEASGAHYGNEPIDQRLVKAKALQSEIKSTVEWGARERETGLEPATSSLEGTCACLNSRQPKTVIGALTSDSLVPMSFCDGSERIPINAGAFTRDASVDGARTAAFDR
jgi:hypothetical protein